MILKVNNLKVWYPIKKGILKKVVNHVKAVNNINFNLNEKQTLGIVGESGSGKTSLVMALLKLIESEGNITFENRLLGKQNKKILRSLRKKMGNYNYQYVVNNLLLDKMVSKYDKFFDKLLYK